jgi:hypothetical protein
MGSNQSIALHFLLRTHEDERNVQAFPFFLLFFGLQIKPPNEKASRIAPYYN